MRQVDIVTGSINPVRLDGGGKQHDAYWLVDTEPSSLLANTDLIYSVLK